MGIVNTPASLVLAQTVGEEGSLFGWYLGLVIAFAVIVVVVVVVASILTLAARISGQAQEGIRALDAGRANTLPLWEVERIQNSARHILASAQAARGKLEEG